MFTSYIATFKTSNSNILTGVLTDGIAKNKRYKVNTDIYIIKSISYLFYVWEFYMNSYLEKHSIG